MRIVKQATDGLKERQNASPVLPASSRAKAGDAQASKPIRQSRGENTCDRQGRMSASSGHSVFVLGVDGKPITPTTPAKARKLLRGGQAEKRWSKFGTFGIQMLIGTRIDTPLTVLGYDPGTKFEGLAVVVGNENVLAIKLDLPDKRNIVRKLEERRTLRRARRHRNCRRRSARFNNRSRCGFLAPSQGVIVGSRLKILIECFRLYPITVVGNEDVRFNHAKHRWGKNFSTIEIGKTKIKKFFVCHGVKIFNYCGFETQEIRKKYGYQKIKDKAEDNFNAHCSDALALACDVGPGLRVEPGRFLVVDDTYRPFRRRLHDTQPSPGGVRAAFARGTVFGLRKGLLICTSKGRHGQLCGNNDGKYLYYHNRRKRKISVKLAWVSSNFIVRDCLWRN